MLLDPAALFHAIVAVIRDAGSATSQGCGDFVEFLCYSGCRVSEAAGVRWQDVDYDRGRIYIAPGKNSADRFIPLIPAMKDLWRASKRCRDGSERNIAMMPAVSSASPNAKPRSPPPAPRWAPVG
jgi:integrase